METEVTKSAASTVRFSCGCGFATRDVLEAINHVLTKEHTVSAYGVIGPREKVTTIHPDTIIVG